MKKMKQIIKLLLLVFIASSCTKEKEIISPSILVRQLCCPEVYYAEILHKEMYSIGDTIRIQYNQMPRHEYAYPNTFRHKYVTVVIVKL
jgi:hypothetical protein